MRAARDLSCAGTIASPEGNADLFVALPSAIEGSTASPNEENVFVFPATPAQRRFWLLDQLKPGGNPALNMSLAMQWHGPLEHEVLRRALNAVVARHEALRTTFDSERGELRQLIAPSLVIELPLVEAEATNAVDLPTQLRQEEAQQPFDLRTGPLVRARLVRLASTEHLLLLTLHHIITDGWSNGILLRDLCEFYSAFAEGKPSPLPELTLQFADFADWQHARLAAGDFAPQRDYWRQKLAGELPALDLPFDRPRKSGVDISGGICPHVLPAELVRAAKELGATESASPFMIFLAVFQVLLHRYTGQTDFLLTTPSANRERQEFEPLVGLFVNPLLLRADLHDDPTFRELLGRARTTALEAFSHQDVPFEALLDEFHAARLQVNFHYDSGLQQRVNLPAGLTSEEVASVSAGTVYELSAMCIEEARGAVRLEIEYNSALFDAATVERMLGHYERLLRSAVADPTAPISALPLLTPEEERTFCSDQSSGTSPRLDIRAPLVERVMEKPDAMIARHGRRELSCAELLARMERAQNANKSGRAPSDLDQAATWVTHWRARVETPPPSAIAQPAEVDRAIAAACVALRECAGLGEQERIAACSSGGAAAAEEIGAALLANAMLVYPTPGLLAGPPAELAAWLEAENIAVACMPAATWNRVAVSLSGKKARKPNKLRLVITTEGEPHEGSFGRVSNHEQNGALNGVRVCTRKVLEHAGGTVELDGRALPAMQRLRVIDARTRQAMPTGVIGELAVIDSGANPIGTGELARWLPNHSLDRLGRATEQTCLRGLRLDLRHIEAAVCELPNIRHALVRSAAAEGGFPFIAYLLPQPGSTLPSDNILRAHLREHGFSDQAIPAAFIPLKEVPVRDEDGRFDLAALPRLTRENLRAAPEPVRPYLGLQLQLIAIWEELLGVRGIGIRDDFFDLGGNSLLAMRMLQRAEHACGKTILPSMLFRRPTIEHLAGELAREVIDESPTLLHVHDGGTQTPFFYLHGDLSGGGFYSLKLSRALGPDQPFYVLPPQDIRMLPAAPSVEEMAAAHLQAIRAVRPHGPYVIGGFCIGGLVAYELARQIEASGDSVEMLLVIDAAPESCGLRNLRGLSESVGTLLRWNDDKKVALFGRLTIWRSQLSAGVIPYLRTKTRTASGRIYGRFRREEIPRESAESDVIAAPDRDLPGAFQWAAASYRPQAYDGPMALLVSQDVLSSGSNLAGEWKRVAANVSVHSLIGSHLECITAHVDTLAEKIKKCLRK